MNQVEALSPGQSCFCSNCTSFRPTKRSSRKRAIKRRKRKSLDQLRALQVEFEKTSEWDKDQVFYLAQLTGLSEAQVYKWGWDQKKKLQSRDKREDAKAYGLEELFAPMHIAEPLPKPAFTPEGGAFPCVETICPSALDFELYQLQRSYK